MKRIIRLNESDLARIVKRVMNESSLLTETVKNTTLVAASAIEVPARTICAGDDYIKASVVLKNTGTEDGYIAFNKYARLEVPPGSLVIADGPNFNVTMNGKPSVSNPDGQQSFLIPKGKSATFSFYIKTMAGSIYRTYNTSYTQANQITDTRKKEQAQKDAGIVRDNSLAWIKSLRKSNLIIDYNGGPLSVPVNFGGFTVDRNMKCDTRIILPKGM